MKQNHDITSAFTAAVNPGSDVRAITNVIPSLFRENLPATACFLVEQWNGNTAWLAEALALFNIKSLTPDQKTRMVKAVFPHVKSLEAEDIQSVAGANARIGRYGFSFPQWRFITQGFSGPSLIERYGMERLERTTDIKNPDLPKSNPDRDQYGTGFIKTSGDWTVEYRRAYILYANNTSENRVAILIRNSSYFFGRDRLPSPAYVSWENLSEGDLRNIDADSFSSSGPFVPWQDALTSNNGFDIKEKLSRITNALDYLDNEDMGISLWLRNDGAGHVQNFIQAMIDRQASPQPPFYLAVIDPAMPPWFPLKSLAANPDAITRITGRMSQDMKMVFLSGPDGDLPLKPAAQNAGKPPSNALK